MDMINKIIDIINISILIKQTKKKITHSPSSKCCNYKMTANKQDKFLNKRIIWSTTQRKKHLKLYTIPSQAVMQYSSLKPRNELSRCSTWRSSLELWLSAECNCYVWEQCSQTNAASIDPRAESCYATLLPVLAARAQHLLLPQPPCTSVQPPGRSTKKPPHVSNNINPHKPHIQNLFWLTNIITNISVYFNPASRLGITLETENKRCNPPSPHH
jgi:hypothetical protein